MITVRSLGSIITTLALTGLARGQSLADFDQDGDVDLVDYNYFQAYFTGPGTASFGACCFDDGTCRHAEEIECPGTFHGAGSLCFDPQIVCVCPAFTAKPSNSAPSAPPDDAVLVDIEIGPVAGLTTSWHAAPAYARVPRGVRISLRAATHIRGDIDNNGQVDSDDAGRFVACYANSGHRDCATADMDADGDVDFDDFPHFQSAVANPAGRAATRLRWRGATADASDAGRGQAVFSADDTGRHEVIVEADYGSGYVAASRVVLDVVDVSVAGISFRFTGAFGVAPVADSRDSDRQLASILAGSQADLTATGPAEYVTSVERSIMLEAASEPPGFEPWCEWRVDGEVHHRLGARVLTSFDRPGTHRLALTSAPSVDVAKITTYKTIVAELDAILQDGSATFHARTEPPGFEPHIVWNGATRYGSIVPSRARGPIARFDLSNTLGADGTWVNLRANEALVGAFSRTPNPKCGECDVPACLSASCCDDLYPQSQCGDTKRCKTVALCGYGHRACCGCVEENP